MTVHVITRMGRREPCLQHPAYCALCADELTTRIGSEQIQKMATMGREAAWDADGREVEA